MQLVQLNQDVLCQSAYIIILLQEICYNANILVPGLDYNPSQDVQIH